jgi:hypothetical protein
MKPIADTAELRRRHEDGQGYIYNDFAGHGPQGANFDILHKATCRFLGIGSVPPRKFFSPSYDAAVNWLNANRGPEGKNWKRCDASNCDCFA